MGSQRGLWIKLWSSWDPLSSSLLQVSLREPPGSAHQPLTFLPTGEAGFPLGGGHSPPNIAVSLCFLELSSLIYKIRVTEPASCRCEDSGQCR